MATWQEIGIDNFRAGRDLFDAGYYRSSVSRFYYAAFSVLTHELSLAGADFGADQETPNHKALAKLIRLHLPLSERKKSELISLIRRLYSARITADYQRHTTNEQITRGILRDTAYMFRTFGVGYD
jgi:uncharacterized protein (UPF0332 family)